jgi:protein-disulfide isomerase
VRIVWKHMPLDMHQDAPGAHLASIAAQKQGKFWEYHDKLFANQQKLKPDDLKRYAAEVGLDVAQFERDRADLTSKKAMDTDKAEAASFGMTGTPGFFVNGKFLSGAKPFEEFAKAINGELTRLNLPVPEGAKGL